MNPPAIESSTPQERRDWIRKEFPCISCCENCGLCQVYHGRDVEDVYREYIEGTRTFDEIAKEYRRTF